MRFTDADLAACCASRRWVAALAGRPYRDLDELRAAGVAALDDLDWPDVIEALAEHPRIGDRVDGWSRVEQSGMDGTAPDVRAALVDGNRAYEERFGHVFLICATGRGAAGMLGDLRARLANDTATERAVVRRELTKIVELRLAKLVDRTRGSAR
ncbi:2-oxo-4-hydroxy-4-carboxy-5-ureidoimidazoline decarboxylase [Actinomadura pelletieri DSM 43383]|uniref:2-oxo-4-hydroxy-4-carboxy-5-ureidoimidazoline decarboxylase n=1 Tax=Actinomadura pelletieri DSM 43383 TaxID=1120940 RepID=A0A495QHP3_9ACTN|nr:2-oxo-4-hydroxy-4-carboxy-5-ureidoimidazoline decarboxylase [Actinomadura pelletieri]RKS71679.1 2-oxo-4-hydroxy-4-carboxy-5-ureidoimidazoline decarboxylase [Actinomadura pelletieri DSM 43383]